MKELENILKNEFINFNGEYSIYANDLNGNVININSSEKYNAASCIKVYILVSLLKKMYFENISIDDKLEYDKSNYVNGSGVLQYLTPGLQLSIKDMATLMMIISDNVATNIIIEYVGVDYINDTIKELGLKNTVLYSKFESCEDKTFGETTTEDYGYIYELIINRKLWNENITDQIIEILKNQTYTEMVGDGIPKIYTETENNLINYVITKSGKYESVRNDGGFVSTKYGNYILIIFIKNFNDLYYLNDKDIYLYGQKISNIIFNRYIALEGKFNK